MGGKSKGVRYVVINGDHHVVVKGQDPVLYNSIEECRKWIKEHGRAGMTYSPAKVWPGVKVVEEVQRRLV